MAEQSPDFARIVLPAPPNAYSVAWQRRYNERVQQLISSTLSHYDNPQYSGVPITADHGSNAAFLVTSGAWTKLPFDASYYTSDPFVTFRSGTTDWQVLFDCAILLNVHIACHLLAGATLAQIQLFHNGVGTYVNQQSLAATADVNFTQLIAGAANDVFDIRANGDKNYNVDMTASYVTIMRLTPDPRITRRV
jgi:hypothetical protein